MKLCFVFLLCRLCDIVFQLCVQFLMAIQFIIFLFFLFKFDLVLDGYLYQCVFKGHHMLNLLCTKKGNICGKITRSYHCCTTWQWECELHSWIDRIKCIENIRKQIVTFWTRYDRKNLQYWNISLIGLINMSQFQ